MTMHDKTNIFFYIYIYNYIDGHIKILLKCKKNLYNIAQEVGIS